MDIGKLEMTILPPQTYSIKMLRVGPGNLHFDIRLGVSNAHQHLKALLGEVPQGEAPQ